MAQVIVSPEAAEALDRLILTHDLPADTKDRFKRVVYRHDEQTGEVRILTVEDARTSNAATNPRA